MTTYKEKAEAVYAFMNTLSKESPDVIKGFAAMHHAAGQNGALTVKEKELIAVGIAITIRCEGCIACHVLDAIKAGATREEIVETIEMAILMGGGPSIVYGDIAHKAMEEAFTAETVM